jgi:ferredoxin-NADP reductase
MELTANYQALFYLSTGFFSVLTLLLSFRVIANKLDGRVLSSITGTEGWRGKGELELVAAFDETHDIKSLVFRRSNGLSLPEFKAGQFISFQIGDDAKLLRSYSISSSPYERGTVQVSVKRLDGGVGSQWMHNLKPGAKLIAHAPSGLFVDDDSSNAPRVYVAGGIGITPFLSMIRSRMSQADRPRIHLFYGMRTSRDQAFHHLLCYWAARNPNLKYFPILSAKDEQWNGDVGYINLAFIKSKISLDTTAKYFMCGPSVMTDKLIDELGAAGVPPEQIHNEKFASPTSFDRSQIQNRNLTMMWNGQKLAYSGQLTILESLEQSGIAHPYACRVGVCGSCKCKVNGKVLAITDAGLSAAEKKLGLVLPCVAFPLEDLELSMDG